MYINLFHLRMCVWIGVIFAYVQHTYTEQRSESLISRTYEQNNVFFFSSCFLICSERVRAILCILRKVRGRAVCCCPPPPPDADDAFGLRATAQFSVRRRVLYEFKSRIMEKNLIPILIRAFLSGRFNFKFELN